MNKSDLLRVAGEPAAYLCDWNGYFAAFIKKPEKVNAYRSIGNLYTEAQALKAVQDAYAKGAEELLGWAVERWFAEVSNRPLVNVHRRSLDDTWRQLIRKLGGDPFQLCGPDHDSLLHAFPRQTRKRRRAG